MRATQQKRQLLGNLALAGDVTGGFPARQGCRRPRSSWIPYPKRHGGDCSPDEDARPRTTEAEEAEFPILQGGTPRHRKAKIARG